MTNLPKRVPRVKIDETEMTFFSSTPTVHPYWADLYDPGASKNTRKSRETQAVKK